MIVFAWDGFPQYAARCVGVLARTVKDEVVVVATRPVVPAKGMEDLCGTKVIWLNKNENVLEQCKDLIARFDEGSTIFVSGWLCRAFNLLAKKMRQAGGRVICMNDANYEFSIKSILRAVWFRLFRSNEYDGYLVPGKSGLKLHRLYGVASSEVASGLYSADGSIFFNGAPLGSRKKRIVYVGQFCERKNVVNLVEAFRKSQVAGNGWTLHLYGCGPDSAKLPMNDPSVEVHDFVQAEELGAIYRDAQVFVLASREEHWGVVVHEAAKCGCALALSDKVGAAADLANDKNAVSFNPDKVEDMAAAIVKITSQIGERSLEMQSESIRLSGLINVDGFVESCTRLARVGAPARHRWIDSWKGLLITLVVLGHVVGEMSHFTNGPATSILNATYKTIYLFHMPAFFLLAGYVFGKSAWRGLRAYVSRRALRLLVPYFFWGILSAIVFLVFAAIGSFMRSAATDQYYSWVDLGAEWYRPFLSLLHAGGWPDGEGFRCNSVLWFLPCMFTTSVLFGALRRWNSSNVRLAILAVVMLGLGGVMRMYVRCILPWGLSQLPWFLFFMLVGLGVSRLSVCESSGISRLVKGWIIGVAIVGYVFLAIKFPNLWFAYSRWQWYLAAAGMAVLGAVITLSLSRLLDGVSLAKLGKRSLGIMVIHKFPVVALSGLFGMMGFDRMSAWGAVGFAVVITAFVLWLSAVLSGLFGKKMI